MQAMTNYSHNKQTGIVSRRGNFFRDSTPRYRLCSCLSGIFFVVHLLRCILLFSQPTRPHQYYHWSYPLAIIGSNKQLQALRVAKYSHDSLHQIYSHKCAGPVGCHRHHTLQRKLQSHWPDSNQRFSPNCILLYFNLNIRTSFPYNHMF